MPLTKPVKIQIKPEVIKWAIGTSGWEESELISKLNISEAICKDWLKGNITIKQLEALADKLKRPLAVFLLPEPPVEDPLPKDYRMLSNKIDKSEK